MDPEDRSLSSWRSSLAALKSHRVPDDDARVVAARQGLAFCQVRRALAGASAGVGAVGTVLLVAELVAAL